MTSLRPLAPQALSLAFALALALPPSAWGQSEPPPPPSVPDESWSGYSGPHTPPPPPTEFDDVSSDASRFRPPAPPPLEEAETPEDEVVEQPPPPPEVPNDVSLFGAPSLSQGRGGVGATVGFPYLSVRALYGVLPRTDVGIAFETVYGAFNDVRAMGRVQLLGAGGFSASVLMDGGAGFFNQPASSERKGMRWITGRRNWNMAPGVALSFQGTAPRAARLFAEGRVNIAFDTEPFQRNPLGGVPAAVQASVNYPLRVGAEFPYSRFTSLIFAFGLDIHTNPDDSAVMPMASMGIVTSLF